MMTVSEDKLAMLVLNILVEGTGWNFRPFVLDGGEARFDKS